MIEIIKARSDADLTVVKTLIYEFIEWLHQRYPEMRAEIEYYFSNQGFDKEMADLLATYGPPSGECLLAKLQGEPAGILMLKPRGQAVCEMNRMFVRASARRNGVGVALGQRLIKVAKSAGYKEMILSALDNHHESLPLYEKLGFRYEERAPDSGNAERELNMRLVL